MSSCWCWQTRRRRILPYKPVIWPRATELKKIIRTTNYNFQNPNFTSIQYQPKDIQIIIGLTKPEWTEVENEQRKRHRSLKGLKKPGKIRLEVRTSCVQNSRLYWKYAISDQCDSLEKILDYLGNPLPLLHLLVKCWHLRSKATEARRFVQWGLPTARATPGTRPAPQAPHPFSLPVSALCEGPLLRNGLLPQQNPRCVLLCTRLHSQGASLLNPELI